MKKLITLFLPIMFSGFLFAENISIEGLVVYKQNNAPTTNQVVFCTNYESGDTLTTETNTDGIFNFSLDVNNPDSTLIELWLYDPCNGDNLNTFVYSAYQENYIVFSVCDDTTNDDECQAGFEYHYLNDSIFYEDTAFINPIQFIDYSIGEINEWLWEFGDGKTSHEQNPIHFYANEGVYNVNLTIYTNSCESTSNMEISVFNNSPDCQAMFEYFVVPCDSAHTNDSLDCQGISIQFYEYSYGEIDQYFWDFGDGQNSTEQNPLHQYSESGIYPVSLTVSSESCESSFLFDVMAMSEDEHCEAFFHYSYENWYDSLYLPDTNNMLTVYFYDYSIGNVQSKKWDFGDGYTSTEDNPVHTYNEPGIYMVTLTIETSECESSITMEVWVGNYIKECEAFFGYDYINYNDSSDFDSIPEESNTIYFYDYSSGDIINRLWDFGDGTTSSAVNPLHTYDSPGEYLVSLEIETDSCESLYETFVWVAGNDTIWYPDDCFAMFYPEYYGNNAIKFINESYGNVESYYWDFGDGNSSWEENPTHTYENIGEYLVKLTTYNIDSCISTFELFVYIGEGDYNTEITAFFVPEINGNTVKFHNQSVGDIWNYHWDFGDGTSSKAISPQHLYNSNNEYTVTLGVANNNTINTFTVEINLDEGTYKGYFGGTTNVDKKKYETNISVFPSPFKSELNINVDKAYATEYKLEITDITGKVLYSSEFNSSKASIKTDHFMKGIYFVTIKSDNKIIDIIKTVK